MRSRWTKVFCPFALSFGVSLTTCAFANDLPTATLTNVSSANGKLTVNYTLDKQAVITFDVQTNAGDNVWVSIGGDKFKTITGLTGTKSAGANTIVWSAKRDWPGQTLKTGDCKVVVKAYPLSNPPNYMIVDLDKTAALENSERVRYYESTEDFPYSFPESDLYRSRYMVMRFIPAKDVGWTMGGFDGSKGSDMAAHTVTLDHNY